MRSLKTKGFTPVEIHRQLQGARRRRRQSGPDLTSVRRALKGATFKRARVETRGGRRILSARNVRSLDAARKRLIDEAKGEKEVHWDDVIEAARVRKVNRTTAAKSMRRAGYDIKWRAPRLKPERTPEEDARRKELCDKYRKLPGTFWTRTVDAYIDLKKWKIPRSVRGRKYLCKMRVRGHLRTRGDGLEEEFHEARPQEA